MNQYNREVIDGMHSTGSYFPDRKLDLPLNSFKTKGNGLHKIFHCKRIEWPSNFRFGEFNQIQSHSKLVPLPNWTYQTLGTNASMPPLWFCRSKNISCLNSVRTDIASSSYTFLGAREGNDRQTVDGNNSIKSKAQAEYLCRRTYNVFHSKRMSKHLRWEWKIKIEFTAQVIYCCGYHFQVLCQNFFNFLKFQRPSNCRRETFSQMQS